MNVIQRVFGRMARKTSPDAEVQKALSLLSSAGWPILGGASHAGVAVSANSQLQIAASFSAIRLIAETVGILPLRLYKSTDKGSQRADDHGLYRLVGEQPNDFMTAVEWKESMAVSLATLGQAYNYAPRLGERVLQIVPVHKSRVSHEIKRDGSIEYRLSKQDGTQITLSRQEICPIRGFGNVGDLEGFAPHALHASSLGLAMAIEKYGSEFFGSGARPTGILTTATQFNAGQRDELRAGFSRYMKESREKGELPVLDSQTTYVPISTPNNDAQFIETRKLQIAEIARIYRVPLHMLMEMDKASYNNTEQANKHFLDYTLMPYLKRIEQGLDSCLLTEKEKRQGLFFKFDVRSLLRGDSTQRAQYYKSMREAGAITQDEIRDLEDLPLMGANDLHVPLNMAPSDALRDIQTKD